MRCRGEASVVGSDEADGSFAGPSTTSQGPNTARENYEVQPRPRLGQRLNPQSIVPQLVVMSDSEGSPPAAASPLEDDDLLGEILLRLPSLPSSLPRASAVCKRWLWLVTDPKFIQRFRVHHKKPPLLGVFEHIDEEFVFTPVLDPPDRIPPSRFSLGLYSYSCVYDLLDCRHGRVLVRDCKRSELVVFNPMTGQQHRVTVPPDFGIRFLQGVVICADGHDDHVHGGCHLSPFKVVLLSVYRADIETVAYVYSSETGLCGNPISTEAWCNISRKSAVLVGNCFYWLSVNNVIVKFYSDEHTLTMITGPPNTNATCYENRQIIQTEDGAIGFAILDYQCLQMWQRNINGHGGATWVPSKTVEIHNILRLPPRIEGQVGGIKYIRGYDEDTSVIFIYVDPNVYMVQLKSGQSKRLPENHHFSYYHRFSSFYTPGTTIAGGSHGAEILQTT